jgi:hypothetical protein
MDVWKCSPADGTNATYEKFRGFGTSPGSSTNRLPQLRIDAEGGKDAIGPIATVHRDPDTSGSEGKEGHVARANDVIDVNQEIAAGTKLQQRPSIKPLQ